MAAIDDQMDRLEQACWIFAHRLPDWLGWELDVDGSKTQAMNEAVKHLHSIKSYGRACWTFGAVQGMHVDLKWFVQPAFV